MPSPETILRVAGSIANEWRALAIAWHAVLATLVLAFLTGWRPSNRVVGSLLVTPLVSVSAMAWASGNPFNGTTFAALALLLMALARRLSAEVVAVAPSSLLVPGVLLLVFGWTYPHFLTAHHWVDYTYGAPFGLLPCPTLSLVIGVTLVFGSLGSKPWSLILAAAGLVYGVVGVLALGVTLDYALLAGAIELGIVAASPATPRWRQPFAAPPKSRVA